VSSPRTFGTDQLLTTLTAALSMSVRPGLFGRERNRGADSDGQEGDTQDRLAGNNRANHANGRNPARFPCLLERPGEPLGNVLAMSCGLGDLVNARRLLYQSKP
jgi:hypothetical protein